MNKIICKIVCLLTAFSVVVSLTYGCLESILAQSDTTEDYVTESYSEKRYYKNTIFPAFHSSEVGSVSNDSVYIKGGNKAFGFSYKITNIDNGFYVFSALVKSSGGQKSAKLTVNSGTSVTTETNTQINNAISEWTRVYVMTKVTNNYCWIGGWYNATASQWIQLDGMTFEHVDSLKSDNFNFGQTTNNKYLSDKALSYSVKAGGSLAAVANYSLEPNTDYTVYLCMKSTGVAAGSFSIRSYNGDSFCTKDPSASNIYSTKAFCNDIPQWKVIPVDIRTGISGKIKMSVWMNNAKLQTAETVNIDCISVSKSGKSIQGYLKNSEIVDAVNQSIKVEQGGFVGEDRITLNGNSTTYDTTKTYNNIDNGVYVLSGYVRSTGGNSSAWMLANYSEPLSALNSVCIEDSTDSASIDNWEYISLSFRVTDNKCTVGFRYRAEENCFLLVDGLRLDKIAETNCNTLFESEEITDSSVILKPEVGKYSEASSVLVKDKGLTPLVLEPESEYIIFARYHSIGNIANGKFSVKTYTDNTTQVEEVYETLPTIQNDLTAVAQVKLKTTKTGLVSIVVNCTAGDSGASLSFDNIGYLKLNSKQQTKVLIPATEITKGKAVKANERGVYIDTVFEMLDPPKEELYDTVDTLNNAELLVAPSESLKYANLSEGGKITDSKITISGDSNSRLTLYKIYNGNIDNGQYTVSAYIRSSGGQSSVVMKANPGKTVDTQLNSHNFNIKYSDWTMIQLQNVYVKENYLYLAIDVTSLEGQWLDIDGIQIKKVGNTGENLPVNNYSETIDLPMENFTANNSSVTLEKNVLTIKSGDNSNSWYRGGVNNLENGTYTLSAYVQSSGGQSAAHMIANIGQELKLPLKREMSGWVHVELKNIPVTNSKLAVGFWMTGNGQEQYLKVKNVQLNLSGSKSSEQYGSGENYRNIETLNNTELQPTTESVYKYLKLNSGGKITDSRIVLGNDVDFSASLVKTFDNIQNGQYTLTAYIRSSGGLNFMYAKAATTQEIVRSNNLNAAYSDWTQIELRNINVTNGFLHISFSLNALAGQCVELDGVQLKQIGTTSGKVKSERSYEESIDLYSDMFTMIKDKSFTETGRKLSDKKLVLNGALDNGTWYWGKIRNLKDGVYTLSAYVKSTGGQKSAHIIANNGKEYKAVLKYSIPDWVLVEIKDIPVKNGKLAVGIWYTESDKNMRLELRGMQLKRSGSQDTGLANEKYDRIYKINNSSFSVTAGKGFSEWDYYHLAANGNDQNKLIISGAAGNNVAFYKSYKENTIKNATYTVVAKVRCSGGQNQATLKVNPGADVKSEIRLDLADSIQDWKTVYIKNIEVTNGYLFLGFFYCASKDNQWLEITDVEVRRVTSVSDAKCVTDFPFVKTIDIANSKFSKSKSFTLASEGYKTPTKLVLGGEEDYSGGSNYNVTDLKAGYYTLSAYVKSSGGQKSAHIAINTTSIAEKEVKSNFKYDISTWSKIEINDIYITDHALIVLWSSGLSGQWSYVDNVQLLYQGDKKIVDYEGGDMPHEETAVEQPVEIIKPVSSKKMLKAGPEKKKVSGKVVPTIIIVCVVSLIVISGSVEIVWFTIRRKRKKS